jgi:hypothetical protein
MLPPWSLLAEALALIYARVSGGDFGYIVLIEGTTAVGSCGDGHHDVTSSVRSFHDARKSICLKP